MNNRTGIVQYPFSVNINYWYMIKFHMRYISAFQSRYKNIKFIVIIGSFLIKSHFSKVLKLFNWLYQNVLVSSFTCFDAENNKINKKYSLMYQNSCVYRLIGRDNNMIIRFFNKTFLSSCQLSRILYITQIYSIYYNG